MFILCTALCIRILLSQLIYNILYFENRIPISPYTPYTRNFQLFHANDIIILTCLEPPKDLYNFTFH